MENFNETADVRKLATIARIIDIKPIEGADNIEKVFVRGWQCVAKKGEFKVGDLCVYIEVDSIMPDGLTIEKKEEWRALNKQMSKVATEEERDVLKAQMTEISKLNPRQEFEFLRGVKFHIKTRRILGEISQGICFPTYILPIGLEVMACKDELPEGYDLTSILEIIQFIPPDPATMGGDAAGLLTGVGLLISDEERIENLSGKYELLKMFTYYKTEKLEGTSITAYIKDGKFGVCGRTVDFQIPEEDTGYNELNVYWKVAKKLDIEEKMKGLFVHLDEAAEGVTYRLDNFAIQGEVVGESVQGNIYKLKGQTVRFYNAFYIDKQEYMRYDRFIQLIKEMGFATVPILDDNYKLPENAIDLLLEADKAITVFGNNPFQLAEGFVYVAKEEIPAALRLTRSSFKRVSFKAKSRTYDMNKK